MKIRYRKKLVNEPSGRVSVPTILEEIAASGKGRWGLVKSYDSSKSAASSASWMRKRYKGWEFSAQGEEVWARKLKHNFKRGGTRVPRKVKPPTVKLLNAAAMKKIVGIS